MKKKSSYQKLKEENAKLLQDIRTLVMHPKSREAYGLHIAYSTRFQLDDNIWKGEVMQITGPTEFCGLINQLKK